MLDQEGEGWEQVLSELAFESSGQGRIFSSIVLFDAWVSFVRTPEGCTPESVRLAARS